MAFSANIVPVMSSSVHAYTFLQPCVCASAGGDDDADLLYSLVILQIFYYNASAFINTILVWTMYFIAIFIYLPEK